MSEVASSLLKKLLGVLIVVAVFLPLIVQFFNLIATFFSVLPVFASYYMRVGICVFVFKLVKRLASDGE